MGLGAGWVADRDHVPAAEDIVEHLVQVAATEPYTVPDSIFDEVFKVCSQIGLG